MLNWFAEGSKARAVQSDKPKQIGEKVAQTCG